MLPLLLLRIHVLDKFPNAKPVSHSGLQLLTWGFECELYELLFLLARKVGC